VRFVGHQLHGSHDAAPLGIEPIVVGTDCFQEPVQIDPAAAPGGLGDLALQQFVETV
jgi:hypothetical protein